MTAPLGQLAPAEPWGLRPPFGIAEATTMIGGVAHDAALVDASFPFCEIQSHHGSASLVRCACNDLMQAEQALLDRFKQRGGHAEIGWFNSDHWDVADMAPSVLYFVHHAPPIPPDRRVSAQLRLAVIRAPAAKFVDELSARSGELSHVIVVIRCGALAETFLFASPLRGQELMQRLIASAQTFASDFRVSDYADTALGALSLEVVLPTKNYMPARQIPPSSFVHDGAGKSEVSSDYSWLWVGQERKLRILLGSLRPGLRRVRLRLANVVDIENLHAAVLFQNGAPRATKAQQWSASTGAVDAEFIISDHDYQVLTLAVPLCRDVAGDGVLRAVCIDGAEID